MFCTGLKATQDAQRLRISFKSREVAHHILKRDFTTMTKWWMTYIVC
jgi:hypothetical protein